MDNIASFSETALLLGGTGVGYSALFDITKLQLPATTKPGKKRTYLVEDSNMGGLQSFNEIVS
jgi:hypothetical protein